MSKTSLLVALSAFLQIFDPNLLPLLLHVLYSSCFYILIDAISILHLLPLLYTGVSLEAADIYELQIFYRNNNEHLTPFLT